MVDGAEVLVHQLVEDGLLDVAAGRLVVEPGFADVDLLVAIAISAGAGVVGILDGGEGDEGGDVVGSGSRAHASAAAGSAGSTGSTSCTAFFLSAFLSAFLSCLSSFWAWTPDRAASRPRVRATTRDDVAWDSFMTSIQPLALVCSNTYPK